MSTARKSLHLQGHTEDVAHWAGPAPLGPDYDYDGGAGTGHEKPDDGKDPVDHWAENAASTSIQTVGFSFYDLGHEKPDDGKDPVDHWAENAASTSIQTVGFSFYDLVTDNGSNPPGYPDHVYESANPFDRDSEEWYEWFGGAVPTGLFGPGAADCDPVQIYFNALKFCCDLGGTCDPYDTEVNYVFVDADCHVLDASCVQRSHGAASAPGWMPDSTSEFWDEFIEAVSDAWDSYVFTSQDWATELNELPDNHINTRMCTKCSDNCNASLCSTACSSHGGVYLATSAFLYGSRCAVYCFCNELKTPTEHYATLRYCGCASYN